MYMAKPFYTYANGYKMCLFIYPNGYGKADGTHVFVSISVMKGENDFNLKWPFRGVITLDQSKQEDHKEVTVSYFECDSSYSSRVCIGSHSAATGKLWMITHQSLVEHNILRMIV